MSARREAVMEGGLAAQDLALLDRIIGLPEKKRERVFRLGRMIKDATGPKELAEIREALAEILFPDDGRLAAFPIGREGSEEGKTGLARHRQYVAKQIRKMRRKAGLSQAEVASRAGIPQSHVSRLETAKLAATYKTIEKVAAALGVKPSQLDPAFD